MLEIAQILNLKAVNRGLEHIKLLKFGVGRKVNHCNFDAAVERWKGLVGRVNFMASCRIIRLGKESPENSIIIQLRASFHPTEVSEII